MFTDITDTVRGTNDRPLRVEGGHRLVWLVAIVGLALGGLSTTATAHDLPRERTLLLQIRPEGLEAMIVYQEPPGKQVQFLKAQYDFDRDDELSGPEAVAAASAWVPRALGGLTFASPNVELDRGTPDVKFRNEHSGALSSAIYLKWDWEALESGEQRSVRIERAEEGGTFETLVRFQTASPLRFVSRPDEGDSKTASGRIGPFSLKAGEALEVEVSHTGDEAKGASGDDESEGKDSPPDGDEGDESSEEGEGADVSEDEERDDREDDDDDEAAEAEP
jgi:hypothetical protein